MRLSAHQFRALVRAGFGELTLADVARLRAVLPMLCIAKKGQA